jgi:hypothetical protein
MIVGFSKKAPSPLSVFLGLQISVKSKIEFVAHSQLFVPMVACID